MSDLEGDGGGEVMQGFAPSRGQAVLADTEWTPEATDNAFAVPQDCTYLINDTGLDMILLAGAIRVMKNGTTYTFDTAMTIEVM